MASTDLSTAVVRRQVDGVQFGMYTDEETRSRSVIEITSPQAFDSLGTALPHGLYDPLLGPSDSKQRAPCPTCGNVYMTCPGHMGHIELCVPVYQPLTFANLLKLLKIKCLACHCFRIERRTARQFAAKFHLIDSGRTKDAMELDDQLHALRRRTCDSDSSSLKGSSRNSKVSFKGEDAFLQHILSQTQAPHIQLTAHERAERRQLVKAFIAACSACKRCANCGAHSPRIRHDAHNKVFQLPLAEANKRANLAERIKIRPASAHEQRNHNADTSGDPGWASDDSDLDFDDDDQNDDDDQDDDNDQNDNDQNDDDDNHEEENFGIQKRKRKPASTAVALARSSTSSNKNAKPDKFMHCLEVEAQIRLTWQTDPFLSSKVFGCAHSATNQGWGIFFMRAIPVPPSRFRPPMILGTMTVEHAQNHYLNKIMQLNDQVRTVFASVQAIQNTQTQIHNQKDATNDNDNDRLSTVFNAMDKEKSQARAISHWIDLQTQINCYIDSSKDPTATPAQNVPSGIRQLLEKKEGIFRKHMMGKRVNYACRSVISPDPYIGTNEIGIPLYFAQTLTYPTPVTTLNIAEMRKLVLRGPNHYPGASWVEMPNGQRMDLGKMQQPRREALAARLLSSNGITKVGRQLRNGDMVLMNRQPSLHKPSIMAHYVRVLHSPTQKTIRMHYANCNTYNADYDGDEMNCHFPQNDIARAESEFIAKTDLQYIVPTDGSPLRGLIQDHVDAGVKLTSKDTFIEKWEYQQLMFAALSSLSGLELIQSDVDIEILPPAIRKPRELWTGKQVITTLLHHLRKGKDGDPTSTEILPGISVERKSKTPNTAFGDSMEEHLVLVRDGELLRGILDKAAFGSTDFSLVHGVYEAYGPTKAGLLLNAFGRLFTAYLQYYSGHSCRMEDLILTTQADKSRRELVQRTYNMGSRAAKAWADSDGGKVEIPPLQDQPNIDKPLKPVEIASTAAKIAELLSGEEGNENAVALDGYMQSQLNPLASQIIKTCLPNGLAVPFPANTFGLMVTTGAKGSTVNQSQVSCALGQQALEGRRVPRMSSGRTMPSFSPFDPNPRADGFIADRFLTGVRPQEYYFHCMAGREGLVDTAVKTSRSGYLQRCLVKHLEELKVNYDHTVRDGEGGVVQFLYGEDGIDPMKAAHLDGTSSTLQYIARNFKALEQRHISLSKTTMDVAYADAKQSEVVKMSNASLLKKGNVVKARKLRFGSEWRRGTLCRGWFFAIISKVYEDGCHFDLLYVKDRSRGHEVPLEVKFSYAGGKITRAESSICTIIKPAVPDPILSDCVLERGNHRIGSSGTCVSETVAKVTVDAIDNDKNLKLAMDSVGITASRMKKVVASKYASALCHPGEAVGCIAAQSIGEPSTQMTLNTFHLAGSGANVTLGIPRLREIIMTASKELKTPTMSVPLHPSVTEREATRLMRYFTRLTLMELISNHGGIIVRESLQQSPSGSWERAYHVTLKLHSAERIQEAFGLTLEDVASVVSFQFMPNLSKIMKKELKRSHSDNETSLRVSGGEASVFSYSDKPVKNKKKSKDYDEDNEDAAGDEDGIAASRFGHKKEMTSYGEMDDEDKEIEAQDVRDNQLTEVDDEPVTVTDDEGATNDENDSLHSSNTVRIDRKRNTLILQPLCVDPATRPLLMVGLVEQASTQTLVRSRPKIDKAFINYEEGRGRCLQTAGCNFAELWNMTEVEHRKLSSNDIWAVRCSYGVEAACRSIVDQIRGVFAVYGISVDPRHLTLIADYMTFDGGYKAMSRGGMADASSSFLQMSFETTANFMIEAALNNKDELMMSPTANIVMGRPVRHGTGAFECIMKN